MSTWICLGTSPAAAEHYRHNQAIPPHGFVPPATIITTNAGILIEPRPDFYWVHDGTAHKMHYRRYQIAQSHGTKIVSAEYARPWMKYDPDIYVEHPLGLVSGTHCLKFAVDQGATEIHAIGYEGYTDEASIHLNDTHASYVAHLMRLRPKIEWRFYGDLNYELNLP